MDRGLGGPQSRSGGGGILVANIYVCDAVSTYNVM